MAKTLNSSSSDYHHVPIAFVRKDQKVDFRGGVRRDCTERSGRSSDVYIEPYHRHIEGK